MPLHRVKSKTSVTYTCDGFIRKVAGCEKGTRVNEETVKNAFLTVLHKLAFSQRLGPGNRIIDLYINSIREREREKHRTRLGEIDQELNALNMEIDRITRIIRFKPKNRLKLNELRTKAEALKREKMALETRPTDTVKAERLRAYLHSFGASAAFPDTAFTEFVERAVIKTGEYIEFVFTCGITLRQSIALDAVQSTTETEAAQPKKRKKRTAA